MAEDRKIVVIGGGLAGLCCARTLQRAGYTAHVYEAGDGVGGRVRTDLLDGFQIDRGFQVLFTAYPAIKQEIDLKALHLKAFDPGALIHWKDRLFPVADPLRKPAYALSSALSPLFHLRDKVHVAKLVAFLLPLSVEEIFKLPDMTMEAFLRGFGFSDAFLDHFIRPFFAGVFLENRMETSARMFAFVFKMLAIGQTALPADGMGALPRQIAADLKPGTLHLNSPIRDLVRSGNRVTGVRLEDGSTVEADRVVVATEADKAAKLTGLELPVEWRVSTDIAFSLHERLYRQKLLVLFTKPGALVNNIALVSNIAPSYAPSDRHLLSATVLGEPDLTDMELANRVKAEIADAFPKAHPETWDLLRVYRIRWAQYAQPVGIWERLPSAGTGTPGLILAGEITRSSSLHGALVSGQRAAGMAMRVSEENE